MRTIRHHIKAIASRCYIVAIAILICSVAGCGNFFSVEKPAVVCGDSDVDCLVQFARDRTDLIGSDINYWSNLLTYALLATIICGLISTVMISLQGDNNKIWTRPIGLVSTALGAAITALLSTFHVQDNIDKLIDIRSKLGILTNNFQYDVRGKDKDQIADIALKFSLEFNKLSDERTKLKGSAGRLNTQPPAIPSPTK
jgi:hypothetical protein